jgi:phage terminase large subunit-like protein
LQTLISEYARDVTSGKVLAGEWVVKAAQRHIDDLARKDFQYKFDEKIAAKVINFIQMLPHTKGRWAQKRELITLEPWQCFLIGVLFGWVDKKSGLRRFREAYIEIPRKNGKSLLAAAIGLYMLVADNEFAAEVYAGATTEKQAWEVFKPARLMAKNTPDLLEHYGLEVNASNLLRLEDFSKFEPLIGNPGDGSSPSCAIADEYHEHKSPDLFDTMQTGMGSREQPLMLVITTAGSNTTGPCYEKRLEAQKVLGGVFDDERLFSVIYSLDEGDDWTDEAMWHKANPNLGVSVSKDFLAAQVASAKRSPSKQSSVKTKHFNQWVGARSAWINMEQWAKGGDDSLRVEDFVDCPAVLGLDLATRIDIAARVTLFWKDIEGERHYYAFPHFYLPESALDHLKNASSYQGWAAGGHIDLMDGDEISFNQIQEDIQALPDTYSIREVAYDPWQATQLAQSLREEGVEAVEFRNTVGNMSPAMRELEGALAAGRFHHPNNPVFNWMASNIVAKEDAKENIFPRKELPENKIDGIVALIMGMGRAMHGEDNSHAYKDRGFITL